MRILLSDGSGLTSRQVARQASMNGHTVDVLAPSRVCLCTFTRHVQRVHRVPAYGLDPDGWLEEALSVLRTGRYDVLLGTQEQVAMLSRERRQVQELGVGLAVPDFEAVRAVQDKVTQLVTLDRYQVPHPASWVAHDVKELLDLAEPPAYLKAPIGTASTAVWHVETHRQLADLLAEARLDECFADCGVVVQTPAEGPLVMVQAIFQQGELVAWHCNLRVREGAGGGASVKESLRQNDLCAHLRRLGEGLDWHGALSADAVLTADGPRFIDINPRLVEPGNAFRAGVDLVDALIRISCDLPVVGSSPGAPGIRTHQLLVGVLGAAQRTGRRVAVLGELRGAIGGRGAYRESVEELTPAAGDRLAAVPLLAATVATLMFPGAWRWFSGQAVAAYALTPAAWRIVAQDAPPELIRTPA